MQFLFRSLVREFPLHRTQRSVSLSFLRDGIRFQVLLRRRRKNDFSEEPSLGELTVIEIEADLVVSAETTHCLEKVSQGVMPHFKRLVKSDEFIIKEQLKYIVDSDGKIKQGREDIIDLLPDVVDQDIDRVHQQLRQQARNLVDTIRWRQDLSGPHEPLGRSGLFWNTNGNKWTKVPGGYRTVSSIHNVLGHSTKWRTAVQRILNEG